MWHSGCQMQKNSRGASPRFSAPLRVLVLLLAFIHLHHLSGVERGKSFIFLIISPVIAERFFSNLHHYLSG
jgi:hypothetical protein